MIRERNRWLVGALCLLAPTAAAHAAAPVPPDVQASVEVVPVEGSLGAAADIEADPATDSVANPAPHPAADAASDTSADDKDGESTPEDASSKPLQQFRMPFAALSERMIGAASRPVRFDWRKSTVGIEAFSSSLVELNNFGSARCGGILRFPLGDFVGELGASWVFTWGTESTKKLARTPYRQPGRPERLELDFNFSFPLAEGIVTAWPGFFPATELVFSATGGFRYLLYPKGFAGLGFTKVAKAVLAPQLTEGEDANLDAERLGGMQVDPARYGLLLGLTTDVYFKTGLFVSPRVLLAVPLLAPMTNTHLRFWWELTLALGLAL